MMQRRSRDGAQQRGQGRAVHLGYGRGRLGQYPANIEGLWPGLGGQQLVRAAQPLLRVVAGDGPHLPPADLRPPLDEEQGGELQPGHLLGGEPVLAHQALNTHRLKWSPSVAHLTVICAIMCYMIYLTVINMSAVSLHYITRPCCVPTCASWEELQNRFPVGEKTVASVLVPDL